jgi:nitrogenase-stabilizing/protective protein
MTNTELAADLANESADEMADLESAEDFLDYFGIAYDPAVVQVCRLHILQRFHNYVKAQRERAGEPERDDCRVLLQQAYDDFVKSDTLTEKVFRVHQKASGIATVSVSAIGRAGKR